MECHTNPQIDCENCVLCSASNKAHSWKNSGQAFLDRVRQKGKKGAEYVLQGISEGSRRFEEVHPKTFEILVNFGPKILYFGTIIMENMKKVCHKGVSCAKTIYAFMKCPSLPSAQRVETFFTDYTIGFYYCGGAMLVAGMFSILLQLFSNSFYLVLGSLLFLFVGGLLVWLPTFYWWDTFGHQKRQDDLINQTQFMDKPPIYESLPPGFSSLPTVSLEDEAPPTYEEISSSDHQGLLHTSDLVPPYALHQPAGNLSTHNTQNDSIVIPVHTVRVPVGTTEPIVMSSASRETSLEECQKISHVN